jgi:glutamate-1-semialdehyde 2,1-aminomutase
MAERQHTQEEKDLLQRAARVWPDGNLGNLRPTDGYELFIRKGQGSRLWDVSGNEYIDYLLGSGPMILGHAHPAVVEAVEEALSRGTTYATQNVDALLLSEEIVSAVPCAEQIRFTTSGTEATFQCLRLARAYRKRDKVLKFEGAYHGIHDYAMMSWFPHDPPPFPEPVPASAGIPKAVQDTVLIAPFNDLETTTAIIEAHHDELAAVIVEPLQRNLEAVPGFLEGVRAVTARLDIPLVFDEVVTGFRLAYGGAQEFYGVVPDLAALGKVVGGGFPLAAVVGSRELMQAYDVASVAAEEWVPQIGTLNGSPVAAAAGLATLKELKNDGMYERYRATGTYLKDTLQRLLDEAEIPAQVSGDASAFDVYFTDHPVTDYRSSLDSRVELNTVFDRTLLENGVFKRPRQMYVGMCHTDADVERTVEVFKLAVAALRE